MRAFIIHLEKDTARKDFMEQQLQKTGIEYEFFQALSAKDIPVEELHSLVAPGRIGNPFCTAWEIGCAISHCRIYEEIVDKKIDKALIFEDDIEINIEKFLQTYALLEKDQNSEYVSLNYDVFDTAWREIHLWEHGGLTWFQKITRAVPVYLYRPIEILQQWYWNAFWPTLLPVLRPLHLAWCYFVTYEWAKKLLATQWKKIQYLTDYLQNEAHTQNNLKLSFISPQITRQAHEKFTSNTRA